MRRELLTFPTPAPPEARGTPTPAETMLLTTGAPLPALYFGEGDVGLASVGAIVNTAFNKDKSCRRLVTMLGAVR